ncbi:tho2 protein [Ophiocordyceps sinensis CO18]|uniref:THO complex subunit 2 n=1 Tax=Ophiocordyceps sinensis (strain Co18 / CGMCC 3.14243) TaxID=911162 RepID=T5ABP4_OPHSC|nr:tho2 protein [Ophiocordyceps sinensis CO18]
MREVLDAQLLHQLGLIRDTFARLGVRQATNLLYRQANYNLLREESEGYSKLITEIFSTNTIPPPSPSKTFEKVKALIGTFDLDVGRVLDVTLDVAATVLIKQVKFFVKFLRISSWWPSSHYRDDSPFVGGLPLWADPSYPHWTATEEDEAENARRKLQRDIDFWDRAREVHIAAFFELGGRRVTQRHLQQSQITNGHNAEEAVADAEQQWIKETNTLPASGNRVAAQLLGFKLRFYNSEMRDKADVLPANLLYLASLLIKIGFISLTDLYPHLSPEDSGMDRVRQQEAAKLEKQEREARGSQMNALLTAGVLPQGDDDNPTMSSGIRKELPKRAEQEQKKMAAAEEAASKDRLPEPMEQKVALLIQLLTIGAIPESLFVLGRFPWIPEVFPEVLQRIHRILHVCLDKVYKDSRPFRAPDVDFPTKNLPDADQAGVPKGHVRTNRLPPRKTWRWPYPDACDTNETQNYRFYLDEWDDNVPVCQTVEDVFTLCNTFLNISGVNIGKDETLLTKLASIGSQSLALDNSEANRARWQDLLRRLLLPALSHTKANASVVNAIWGLVKQYPLITRYSMYAEWFEGQTSRLPAIKVAFARATSETRATMKRVSLTNLSEMAKRLAKTSYASPGIVFKVAFEQLEVYSNLIEAFVECAKYFTDLSYDVLVWSLLNSLGKSRSRTQENHALTTSKWLQALSRFSGKVFRRYPVLNPVPVLQYVDEQLFQGNATDLIILEEFVSSMGGIVDAVDFTDYQVLSMAGGAWLRRHTLIRAQDKRFENSKSSYRLIQALSDSKLAARLLINLAQFRQTAVYKVPEEEAHIKYLSSIIDDSHQMLILYLDFLWSNLDPADFDTIVPSIPTLISSFGLQTELAFLIGRNSLAHRMFPWKENKLKKDAAQARRSGTDKEGDVKMSDAKPQGTELTEAAPQDAVDTENQQVVAGPVFPGNASHTRRRLLTNMLLQKPDDASLSRTALTAMQPIIDSVKATVPPSVWDKMTPELYTTFWALQLGDLCFPEEVYVKERQKIMSEWQTLANDRSDMSRRAVDRKMEKRKELMDLQGYLLDELSEHGLRKAKWKFYLTKMFQASFPGTALNADGVSDVLLEQCFLPRLLLSPADAEYTFRFIKALHDSNAPAFKLMSLYDRLFNANRLRVIIFTCTVRETEYLGRFLKLMLEDLARWHKNEPAPSDKDGKATKDATRPGAYDREGKGTADQPRLGFALTVNAQGKPETFVDHDQFRDLLFRWHKNLNMALKACLSGSEWMHIRNAITVLKAVLDYFPAVDFMAAQFTAQLQKITKREAAAKASPESEQGGRVDLSVAAQGAMSELQKRKSKWVMVQAFRSNKAAGGSRSEGGRASNSNLRPTAVDFKPHASKYVPSESAHRGSRSHRKYRPATAKASAKASVKASVAEKEDGEVQDATDSNGQSRTDTSKEPQPSRQPIPARDAPARQDEGAGPSRPSTPRAGPTQTNPDSRAHRLPDRPTPHTLPTRPDVPIPGHAPPERYAQSRSADRRDGREPRAARDAPRDAREAWDGRETRDAKEHREIRDSRPHESDRAARPNAHPDRRAGDATGEGPRADLPPRPGQHERDRQYRDSRAGGVQNRHNEAQGQSSGPVMSESSDPAMNPERAAFFAQDGQDRPARGPDPDRQPRAHRPMTGDSMDAVNAERGALIEDRNDGASFSQNRPPRRDDGHERAARAQSPRRVSRHAQEHGSLSGGFEDRHARPYGQDPRALGRDPRDRSPMTGHNYRGDRPMDRDAERGTDKMRDPLAGFHRPGPREPGLEQRMPHHDQNYGRLNPVSSTTDVPSGPRGRGRNATQGGYGAHSSTPGRPDGRFAAPETPRTSSPDRLPPTGPASGRGRHGGYEPGLRPGTPSGTHGDVMWQDGPNWGPANGGDGPPRRERGERDNRNDRPGRSSRRSSRERERSPRTGREGETKEHAEYRDRRSMGNAEVAAKEREPRRMGREAGGRNMIGPVPSGGRDLTGPRDPRHRVDGAPGTPGAPGAPGGHRASEEWAGGRGGAGYRAGHGGPREMGMRPSEERHESRDDRGRKRRSEDGVGLLASERDKRPRRG